MARRARQPRGISGLNRVGASLDRAERAARKNSLAGIAKDISDTSMEWSRRILAATAHEADDLAAVARAEAPVRTGRLKGSVRAVAKIETNGDVRLSAESDWRGRFIIKPGSTPDHMPKAPAERVGDELQRSGDDALALVADEGAACAIGIRRASWLRGGGRR